jgi:putative FmdB family regulatory protein
MPRRDMVCTACSHAYEVVTPGSLKDEQANCPKCGADTVRQTFASYLRNGALLDPKWGCRSEHSGFG